MNIEADKLTKTNIAPLTLRNIHAFMRLRKQIEWEADHLAVGKGERKETIFHVLARKLINRGRMYTFLAFNEGDLVGYITILLAKFKKLKGNAYITMAVSRTHRGKGIGTLLLHEAETFARARGVRRIELEVFSKNEGAIRLYERLGYEQEGRRREAAELSGGYDDVIFMAKFLNSRVPSHTPISRSARV